MRSPTPGRILTAAVYLLSLSVLCGCTRTAGVLDAEQAALQRLEDYDAKHEVDEKKRIVRLVLEGKQVTDAALEEIPNLPHLRKLSLRSSSVTDAGLLKLWELKRLENLGITNTLVTDRGLGYLERMPSLQNVWVCEGPRLTARGIASLRNALPQLKVHVMNGANQQAPGQTKKTKSKEKT